MMCDAAFPIEIITDLVQAKFFWARDMEREEFIARLQTLFRKHELIVPKERRLRAYIGASLFTSEHLKLNRDLKQGLNTISVDAYLPQEDGGLVAEMVKLGIAHEEAMRIVFRLDAWAISNSDLYIGGRWEEKGDEGECWEHGCAWALSKPCLAIYRHLDPPVRGIGNPMLTQSLIHEPFSDTAALCAWLKDEIEKRRVG